MSELRKTDNSLEAVYITYKSWGHDLIQSLERFNLLVIEDEGHGPWTSEECVKWLQQVLWDQLHDQLGGPVIGISVKEQIQFNLFDTFLRGYKYSSFDRHCWLQWWDILPTEQATNCIYSKNRALRSVY